MIRRKAILYIILLIHTLIAQSSVNDNDFDWITFGHVLVVDEGRLQPLKTYAMRKFIETYGSPEKYKITALKWIADQFFTNQLASMNSVPLDRMIPHLQCDLVSANSTWSHELNRLSVAYVNNDQKTFNALIKALYAQEKIELGKSAILKTTFEEIYCSLPLRLFSQIVSALLIIAAVTNLRKGRRRSFVKYMVYFNFFLLTVLLALRTVILNRPPIATLYETFIAFAWFITVLPVLFKNVMRQWIHVAVLSSTTLFALICAGAVGNEFTSMGPLNPVLNSNFWLTVHISTIVAGFAGFMIVSVLGHVLILQSIFDSKKLIKVQTVYVVLCSSLLITATGTGLGGLWADLSWGRFWGWDPKENGALLLILWSSILIHAYKHKLINDFALSIGTSITGVLVMCTWIGINLLGKGMHAYGFIDNGKNILILCLSGEGLFFVVILAGTIIKHLKIQSS